MSTARQAIRARRKASKDPRYASGKARLRIFRGHLNGSKKQGK